MKPKSSLPALVALLLSGMPVLAQDTPGNPPPPPNDAAANDRRGPAGHGHRPGGVGLFGALDRNHDGAIDRDELAQAVELLRRLDADRDGRITLRELARGGQHRFAAGGERQREDARPPQGGEPRDFRGRGDERSRPSAAPSDAPQPPPREARREGPGAPGLDRQDRGPRPDSDRFAQQDRPRVFDDHDRRPTPWQDFRREEHGPLAFARNERDRRGPGRELGGRPELRNELGSRGPQGPAPEARSQGREMSPPPPYDRDRSGPPARESRDDGRPLFGPRWDHPHRPWPADRGPRPPAPDDRDVQ